MFLPRASANSSSSSGKSDSKLGQSSRVSPFQQSPRRHGLMKASAGQGAAAVWSQSTTAPPSVQVHYHYLAGRYRDLSNERGLGLSGSGIPSSTSTATLGGILESERDDAYSLDGDARSIILHPSPCKTPSASSSLRAIARKTGVSRDTSPKARLQDLFGEKDKKFSPTKLSSDHRRELLQRTTSSPNKGKNVSLRSYAEERLKAQEAIESRIEQATDTGRLKWEARAAMLNSNFTLAILLYTRAAQLGSISAALSLAHIYATGLTRGNKPMVVLVYRDPLRSLAWALEAARLLQRRTDAREKKRRASTIWSIAETNQPAQIVALISRLLRSKEAGLTAASDTTLPRVRKRRSGKEKQKTAFVWDSVCESMEWLDQQIRSATAPTTHDDGHSVGPDDDEQDLAITKQLQSCTNVALIEALVASRRWIVASVKDEGVASSQAVRCWEKFRQAFRKESHSSPRDLGRGELSIISLGSESLSIDGNKFSKNFIEALDESLTESGIPVESSAANNTLAQLESPSKRMAGQRARKIPSLEELVPLDAHAMQLYERARRPSLLRHHSSSALRPTTTLASSVSAQAAKEGEIKGMDGNNHRPRLTSSATIARLESLTIRSKPKGRGSLPKARRMSITPSLLFPSRDDDDEPQGVKIDTQRIQDHEDVGMPSSSSVVGSLWKAAPLHARQPTPGKPAKERVASLYGSASVATSEKINTEGSSTYAYDVDAALLRQQSRRRRGDSNASISTIASMLSTNPSIAASVTDSEYAKGQFLSPSTSSNFNGFDFRAGGAADSLRRIRKASFSSNQKARDIPTAPRLSDTLEDVLANSASYRAVNAKASVSKPRTRRDSNASLRSLTAFTGNNQRQTSYGDMRPTSLFPTRASSVLGMPAISTDRGGPALRSPTLSVPTSFFNVTPQTVNGTVHSRSRAPSHGAIGSLRLLGRQASSQSAKSVASAKVVQSIPTAKQAKDVPTSPCLEAATEVTTMSPVPSNNHHRSFAALDPTHSTSSKPNSQTPSPAGSTHHQHHTSSNKIDAHKHHHSDSVTTLDPALAEAEERSGLKTTSTCMVCHIKVVNAPVSKSGDVFCGRDCRIEMKRRRALEAKAKGQA
jgi:hypothetical protein